MVRRVVLSARWHRVVPTCGPWVAPCDASHGEPGSPERTVSLDCLQRVRRTRGIVPAHLSVQRTDGEPVHLQQADQDPLHRRTPPESLRRRSALSRSRPSSAPDAPAADGRARTTTRDPAGRRVNRVAIRCRNLRFTRFRATAEPTRRLTTNPTWVDTSVASRPWTTTVGVPARRPRRVVRRNSRPERSRWPAGSTAIRLRASGVPGGVATTRSRDPPGSACADGIRVCALDDGCSVGTCACSREGSPSLTYVGSTATAHPRATPARTR